ncbi:MAG TPA: UvrD-helicase domain-containing protein [Candidatus Nanoarchaeia archaeon]|nr:UvrD-helicase domain-containing protein [Candidatus Nanoarchaeia archaeon]
MPGGKELDYLVVLKALQEIPFGVGKNLLIDFLQGQKENESIARNKLHLSESFGSLAYEKDELSAMIDGLSLNGLIDSTPVQGNRFWKVLLLTPKGKSELVEPTLYKRKLAFGFKDVKTTITASERQAFSHFGDFLASFNDEQKKAVISTSAHILCLAGAGSGKTAVLTKRIELLVRYRSVEPSKILAITFTRKARQEMQHRLENSGFGSVSVETFNSFCEKILQRHANIAYGKPVRVISYRDRIALITRALGRLKLSMRMALAAYFTPAQQRDKTEEQLANVFMNDCFFIRDYFKSKNKPVELASFDVDASNERSAQLVFGVCRNIDEDMAGQGLRDFADQLLDAIALFENNPSLVPRFEHVLIDEYQDVNSTQIKLVSLLEPPNLFCVGDPRQSIYGWRGSDVRHMLNFSEKYPGCEIITLTKNYRSTRHIVSVINCAIRSMGLPDLEFILDGEKDVHLLKLESEPAEFEFVIQHILGSKLPRKEIFVLARTNRQLNDLSTLMKARGIAHVLRSDEMRQTAVAGEGDVTLATIHAIKGLEAELVFVIGCTSVNFPAKGSEHPVIEMVKVEEYDKEEEEKRLFYVALSRAKKSLFLTYSGKKCTSFISQPMMDLLGKADANLKLQKPKLHSAQSQQQSSAGVIERLKEWRRELARKQGIPAFMILHDRTIIELAQQLPSTREGLEAITGLGPMKIVKYGEEILRIVGGGV